MIISDNTKPTLEDFKDLMHHVDIFLNNDAKEKEDYYLKRNGTALEADVFNAANVCAKNTVFEDTIKLVSGFSFPDIVANHYYGIEVKSTKDNNWKSIGSSILESTRIRDVERIYLTFGKLSKPVGFISRPYEECLYGIAVTHSPRYQIDMNLAYGETIFDKLGIPYDSLRKLNNPIKPVADYYRKQLKPGESLWWTGDDISTDIPMTVKLWTSLNLSQKSIYTAKMFVLFPECVLSKDIKKYTNATLWLATQCGIVNSNVRDSFSAGGKIDLEGDDGTLHHMPGVYKHLKDHIDDIIQVLTTSSEKELTIFWSEKPQHDRISQWINLVLAYENDLTVKEEARNVLTKLFKDKI